MCRYFCTHLIRGCLGPLMFFLSARLKPVTEVKLSSHQAVLWPMQHPSTERTGLANLRRARSKQRNVR
ncbi:unnamed protein product [Arctogadus glacialis]